MDLRQYLRAIRKFWWVALIPTIVGIAFGMFSVSGEVPQYRASMTFFIRTVGDTTANGQFAGDQFAQRRVNSYVSLLSTDRLARGVIDTAKVDLDPDQVRSMIGATGDVNTVLLTATVTSESEEMADVIAQAVSTEFVKFVDEVENVGGGPAAVSVDLVSGPSVSQVPSRPVITVGMYALLGLGLGLALAVAFELRDLSVRNDEQVDQLGAGPVLAHIPLDRTAKGAPLAIGAAEKAAQTEAFRRLRTNLQFIDVERPVQVLVVTSSVPEEGKSTTTANLALALVAARRKVLVVEADLRRPKVAEYFGMDRSAGLTDVLASRVEVEDVVQPWGPDGLDLLSCGQLPPNPSELLGSEAMTALLERLRGTYDNILIDTPPLLPVTDGAVVATRADGVALVVRHGRTTRHQLSMSVRSLEAVGVRLLGTVMTMVPASRTSGYATYEYEASGPVASEGWPAEQRPRLPHLQRQKSP